MNVALSFFPDGEGSYSVETRATPEEAESPFGSPVSASVALTDDSFEEPRTWVFRQAVPSPNGTEPLIRPDYTLNLYVYQPHDVDKILDFDRRITERYSQFFADHGEFYAGTFTCDRLGPQYIVEWAAFAFPSRESANQAMAIVTLDNDVQQIVDECKGLQNRNLPRWSLWLTPR